jgi:diguanylate cyclase (GGDEF)-like protein
MQNSSAKATIIGWLDLSIPDQQLHFDLVQALYRTPKSILGATIASLVVMAMAWAMSGDSGYGWFFAGFGLVGVGRIGTIVLYNRSNHVVEDRSATIRWERAALLNAWAFACLVGFSGAYTVVCHPGTDVELLINTCVMGYIAGISSRNSSRPIISIGQVSFTAFPFAIALLVKGGLVHIVLAAFLGVLYVSIIMICRSVFDNFISGYHAFRKIELIAHRDTLTDLWNRTAFIGLLEKRLSTASEKAEMVGLVLIDMDHFKDVNDTFGHQTGDLVLQETGERIKSVIGSRDEAARIGGDEFVVMLAGASESQTRLVAERILARLAEGFTIGAARHYCGASIGYALAPGDGSTIEELFRNADLALYEAKQGGRGLIVRHSESITQRYDRRVQLEHDLQSALENGEFELVYQPIVDPRSGRAICCEALLRWSYRGREQISPAEFIPIAEATELIVPIGAWVLATACAEAKNWPADIKLAVNLSTVQFRRGRELVEMIIETLGRTGLPPHRLELEITESVLIEDSVAAHAILKELRDFGIGIALDDFGTGFASLAYLNDFPFSQLKIDRKFSQGIEESPRTAAIIGGIAKITRDLHIELVAEGIETEIQCERMRRFGIVAMQGFLFCRPMRAQELRQIVGAPIFAKSAERGRERDRLASGQLRKAVS